MPASAHSPLRKVPAFRDLPSLAIPDRFSNPPSYPYFQPLPGARISNESPLPPVSPFEPTFALSRNTEDSIYRWISTIPDIEKNSSDPDMFPFPEKYGSAPSTPGGSPISWIRPMRRRSWMLASKKLVLIACGCLGILILNFIFSIIKYHVVC